MKIVNKVCEKLMKQGKFTKEICIFCKVKNKERCRHEREYRFDITKRHRQPDTEEVSEQV